MEKLFEVKKIKKYFPIKKNRLFEKTRFLKAVDSVSFDIYKGETLGVVGESGSGKSTLGRCITNIHPITDGEIFYDKVNITSANKKQLNTFRSKIQAVFQDLYSSLNPKLNVLDIVSEPIKVDKTKSKEEIRNKVFEVLDMVGISRQSIDKRPHEFSGGQRQRISIARAISTNPQFILCDEAISALDVSIQAQIVNLLEDIQKELGLTYLFIAHNLSMVRHISNRIMVMYLGNVVEIGNSDDIYKNPLHPYTIGLLKSQLEPVPKKDRSKPLDTISMDIPSPIDTPKGCPFATRCDKCMEICTLEKPELIEVENTRKVACFLVNKNPDFITFKTAQSPCKALIYQL